MEFLSVRRGFPIWPSFKEAVIEKFPVILKSEKKIYFYITALSYITLRTKNKISYYLRTPKVQPEYRAGRAHKDFLLLSDLPALNKSRVVHLLINAFEKLFQTKSKISDIPDQLAKKDRITIQRLVSKYYLPL